MTDFKGLRVARQGKIYLFIAFCMVSILVLGAGIAQSDIYLRPNSAKDDSAKTDDSSGSNGRVFLRRNYEREDRSRVVQPRVQYGSRLDRSGLKNQTLAGLKNLDAWRKSGRTPKTPGELQAYALATRAPTMVKIIEESERTNARLARQNAVRDQKNARLERAKSLGATAKKMADARLNVSTLNVSKANGGAPKKRVVNTVYRRAPTTLSKPKKVFRDYR